MVLCVWEMRIERERNGDGSHTVIMLGKHAKIVKRLGFVYAQSVLNFVLILCFFNMISNDNFL